MKPVFADTFYWIALTDRTDSSHIRVRAFNAQRPGSLLITTDEVLTEYLTFFAAFPEPMRRKAIAGARKILTTPGVRVVPQTRASLLSGMDLYGARPDKQYSLTDCISMQTMWREGVSEVLTNDRHFDQEGFRALFREPVH